jgi:membrane protein implicated in regulation of membrane protease activity
MGGTVFVGVAAMLDTIFLVAAVIGGTVLVCQFVLTIMGLGGHDANAGFDGSADGCVDSVHVPDDISSSHHTPIGTAADAEFAHPDSSWLFGVLSFRTLVAAAAFFGVAGKAALSAGFQPSTAFVLAALVGITAMYGMYWLMKLIGGLNSSGNERIDNALGQTATVYIPIPAAGKGAGKVQLSMQNRIVEYRAVTDDDSKLNTGETVEVVDIAGSDVLCVRRVAEIVGA